MALLMRNLISQFCNITKIKFPVSTFTTSYERFYSVFPPTYVKPIYDKKTLKYMDASESLKEIKHLPIKPATTSERSSEFYDPVVEKFINFLMRKGNKLLARWIFEKTFEYIKLIQIERYHKANVEEQAEIELDPKVILHKAIDNCCPSLELLKMKRGGRNYQVPIPVREKRSRFLAITWLIDAGKDKKREVKFYKRLAHELIDAHNNTGRVIKRKQDLYKQCEANRSYAHFRWI